MRVLIHTAIVGSVMTFSGGFALCLQWTHDQTTTVPAVWHGTALVLASFVSFAAARLMRTCREWSRLYADSSARWEKLIAQVSADWQQRYDDQFRTLTAQLEWCAADLKAVQARSEEDFRSSWQVDDDDDAESVYD